MTSVLGRLAVRITVPSTSNKPMIVQPNISLLKSRISRGFTLIELLVVIAIIGILITVGAVSYQRAVRLSRDSKRKTDLEQIRQALETYRPKTVSTLALPAGRVPCRPAIQCRT